MPSAPLVRLALLLAVCTPTAALLPADTQSRPQQPLASPSATSPLPARRPILLAAARKPAVSSTGLMLLCCVLAFATDSNGAMAQSFYANHFVARGVSTSAIGLMLGLSNGAGLLGVAPLAPRLIRRFGAAWTMLCSALTYAACRFAMAALAPVRAPRVLICCAALSLTVQAFADALCDIAASTTILTSVPQKERTQAQGTFLALRSLGSLIAPPLGGWLYLVGGFALPFVAFGALLVVACLPVMRLILLSPPPTAPESAPADDRSILGVPSVRRILLTMTIVAACMTLPVAYFSPFLKHEHLMHEGQIGLAMMGAVSVFTLSSVGAATLEKRLGGVTMLALGCGLTALGFFLASALPPFSLLPRRLLVTLLGMCIYHAGIGLVFAAASPLCVQLAEHAGFGAEAAAAQTTSLWVLAFGIAGSAAPPVGGLVAQLAGFRWANALAGGLPLLATLPLIGMRSA